MNHLTFLITKARRDPERMSSKTGARRIQASGKPEYLHYPGNPNHEAPTKEVQMATSKITSNTERIRRGSLAALEALRRLEASANNADLKQTAEEYYAKLINDTRALADSLGPLTPEQQGAITCLAEYIHMSITSGSPNLEPGGWKPIASMTEEELQREIAETSMDMLS